MKRSKQRRIRKSSPKHSLSLPDLDQARSALLNSLPSKSQRGYRHAIDEFMTWYCSRLSFNKAVVTRYRTHLESRQLAPGTINGRLAAVRRLACEAADSGLLSPDLAAGIRRVRGPKNLGVRLGNWLTADQSRALWQAPDPNTLKGKRDRALLGILLGCGLRRKEAAELDVNHLQRREDHWAIVDLVGKGRHIRTVPVPDWVKRASDSWLVSSGVCEGRVFRCVCRTGGVAAVKDCAKRAGIENLAPHDLRRTCARLCRDAGGEVEQIQFLLGHVCVQTTEKYLGCKQRLQNAVNDRIGIKPNS